MEWEMHLEYKTQANPNTVGLELGDRGAGHEAAVGVAEAQQLGPWCQARGLAPYLEWMGAPVGFQKRVAIQIRSQKKSMRGKGQVEAHESSSPGRRKELGRWDLLVSPAETSRTLGRAKTKGCGRGSRLPLLRVEGDGRCPSFPGRSSGCGPCPKCLPLASPLGLGARACPLVAKLEVSSTQDSMTSDRGGVLTAL